MSQLSQDPRQDVAPSAPARTAPRPESRPTTAERLIGVLSDPSDPDWRRPGPGATGLRRDVLGALALFAVAALILALLESFAGTSENRPRWLGYLMVALQILPLAGRRRRPAAVMVVSSSFWLDVVSW